MGQPQGGLAASASAAWRSAAVAGLLLGCLASPGAAEGEDPLDGLTIVAIRVERHNIFDPTDPKTSSWFHRGANALHVVSKERFVRSMLPFEEGDPYSASEAAESARILRGLGIMTPVSVTARPVEGGVAVIVETTDRWTLQVGGDFSRLGNRTEYEVELEEGNVAGWGKTVGVSFESEEVRTSRSYHYFDPSIVGSRWQLDLMQSSLSDGHRSQYRVSHPFYSLETRRYIGVEGSDDRLIDYLYARSDEVVRGDRASEYLSVTGGFRLHGGPVTRRLIFGWTHRRDEYSDWSVESDLTPYPTPDNLAVEGPSIAYQRVADRFLVVRGFRAWTVQEDVALGPNLAVSATVSLPAFGGDRERLLFSGVGHAARMRDKWLRLADVWLSGRLEAGESRDLLVGFQLALARLGRRGWQVRLMTEHSRELDLQRQLTLGADLGLRGWDPDYFDGTGRAVLNVQWRTLFADDAFGLLSVGGIVFADAGSTWAARVGTGTGGVRFDGGVGLLFDLSHLSRTNLLRLDLAWPDDGSGPAWSLSSSTIFRLPETAR